jgi:predicted enzyme related to lactoylglutathione lyase
MTQAMLRLTQITLATNNTEAMVHFYSKLFALDLQATPAYGTTLYRGTLHAVPFVLCPNSLAGVEAHQSRQQFTYSAPDLSEVITRALGAGGTVHEEARANERLASVTILDPDGNSIVFRQDPG